MIIHVPPDAPFAVRAAADTVLVLHIGGGVVGIAAGSVALAARKGERAHRAAGNAFFLTMLVAYLVGAAAAPLIHQPANVFGGVFAAYLVATAWLTVKRPEGQVGRAEVALGLAAAAAGLAMAVFAWFGAHNPRGIDGVPWQAGVVFAVMGTFAAGLDLRLVRRRGIAGAARIRRHLWRMCLGLFIGATSFFLGQPKVFPPPLRGSPLLFLPPLAVLVLMAWWLARTGDRAKAQAQPA